MEQSLPIPYANSKKRGLKAGLSLTSGNRPVTFYQKRAQTPLKRI
jgi:hypothetical protein